MPFKFIVDGTDIYVHAGIIARHSVPLDRMIKSPMKESEQGFAILKDVDEGTFLLFVQWAYSGYYIAGNFSTDSATPLAEASSANDLENTTSNEQAAAHEEPAMEETSEAVVAEDRLDWGTGWPSDSRFGQPNGPSSIKKDRSKKKVGKKGFGWYGGFNEVHEAPTTSTSRRAIEQTFHERETKVYRSSISVLPPRANTGPNEDYTEVFLSHARLYVFAEEYDIQTLKALALENLQLTLRDFTLFKERTGDIIALLSYIYSKTGESRKGVEDLRTLLTHYLGYEMDTMMTDPAFRDLVIEDGGEMLHDFFSMVRKRI